MPSSRPSDLWQASRKNSAPLVSPVLVPDGLGSSSRTASWPSIRLQIKTPHFQLAPRPYSASTFGSTPTTSSIRTCALITSRRGGTSSIGTPPPSSTRRQRSNKLRPQGTQTKHEGPDRLHR